jgi:cell division protein FtsX
VRPKSRSRQQILEIEMASLATILTIGCIAVLAALFAWLLRCKAKATATYQRRAAILASIREQSDTESPIMGWMVSDVPARAKSARKVRDLR